MNILNIEILSNAETVLQARKFIHFFSHLGISIPSTDSESLNRNLQLRLIIQSFNLVKKIKVGFSLSDSMQLSDLEGILYFQSHRKDQLEIINRKMNEDFNFRIYFICHNYYDVISEFEKIILAEIDRSRIIFIFAKNNKSLHFKQESKFKYFIDDVKYNEICYIDEIVPVRKTSNGFQEKHITKPYLVVELVLIILTPLKFIKIFYRKSSLIWMIRFKELLDFLFNFLLQFKIWMIRGCYFTHRMVKLYLMYPLFKIYWFLEFQYQKRIKKRK